MWAGPLFCNSPNRYPVDITEATMATPLQQRASVALENTLNG